MAHSYGLPPNHSSNFGSLDRFDIRRTPTHELLTSATLSSNRYYSDVIRTTTAASIKAVPSY
jgi:hypothetical protein